MRYFDVLLLGLATAAAQAAELPLYKDPTAPIPARARDLLARMTVEEKVAQLLQPWETKNATEVYDQYKATGLGAWYLTMTTLPPHAGTTGPDSTVTSQGTDRILGPDARTKAPQQTAAATVKARNEMQHLFVEHTRLGIPVSFIMETLHSGGPDGTIFPMPVNYAASWNTSALRLAASIQAAEARAVGTDRGFSPVINVFPDARYGRVQEGFSEDPYVTKVMGAAHLAGLQGGAMGGPETYLDNFTHALVATVKHYAAYGMTAGGIDGSPADLSEQKLREIYLSPWAYLVPRGLRSVMAAQNMVNGRPMHANRRLLTEVLREEWNVTAALVESDGGDCIGALQYGFHIAETREEVSIMSLEAGMDMDLGGVAFPTLVDAVKAGRTEQKHLDRAAYNVLVSKFAAGLFENPYTDESRVGHLDSPDNRKIARDHAEQGFVLLINNNKTLPLGKKTKLGKLALVGPLADDGVNQCGSYFNAGADVTTVKAALETEAAAAGFAMSYSYGANPENTSTAAIAAAVEAAKAADVVVAVVGDTTNTCGEMVDRSGIDLPGGQLALLSALAASGTPVVVLLIHGRPATFGPGNAVLDSLAALVVGWRPGEEGGPAFANLLMGRANPSGRLTQNWPRSVGAIGGPSQYMYPYQGNHMGETYSAGDGPSTPLFRFGEGMSYTEYVLDGLVVAEPNVSATGKWKVTLTAHNTGAMDGAVPVQLYFRKPFASPVRLASIQLVRFEKVWIPAGSSVVVEIELVAADLGYWDDGRNGDAAVGPGGGWVVQPGGYELVLGTAGFTSWSTPAGLHGTVRIV